ncbi:MAG: subclass B3 metallo-beta-lactamase [Vicinamibacterales bacterium]
MIRYDERMRGFSRSVLFALTLATASTVASAQSPTGAGRPPALVPDPPAQCSSCAEWNAPRDPFKVFGNTYYVGPAGVSALLITTPRGHILVDTGLQQSAEVIDRNIRALGFKTTDVKLILTSHGHYDHVGGVHALQRYTGATVLASVNTARALALGAPVPEDPQAPRSPVDYFPKAENVRVVKDGEVVSLGGVSVTAHYVPGHTPGATTWTWDACEGTRCLHMVYADSVSSISNDGFRFTGDATHPSLVESFRDSIRTVAALPCDIMISTHPAASNMDEKLKKRAAMTPGSADPMIDPGACRALAAGAMTALEERVKTELASPPKPKP